MVTTNPPNQRLLQLARRIELLATNVTHALEHVLTELAYHDSMPTQCVGAAPATVTHGDRQPCKHCGGRGCDECGPVEMTRTERAALARAALTSNRATIYADIDTIESVVASAEHVVATTMRQRVPTDKPRPALCSPVGHEGGMEWGDPLCSDLATRTGLCDRHYVARRRWRIKHELPTNDVEAA